MRAPKEKLRITVVPPEAPLAGMSANDVALLLARLIGKQIARDQENILNQHSETKK